MNIPEKTPENRTCLAIRNTGIQPHKPPPVAGTEIAQSYLNELYPNKKGLTQMNKILKRKGLWSKASNIGLIPLSVIILSACSKTVFKVDKSATPTETDTAAIGTATKQAPALGELTVAAFEGDLEKVRTLLSAGAYINENIGTEADQVTPLIAAIANKQNNVADFLVDRGAAKHPSYMHFNSADLSRYQNQFETLRKLETSQK